MARRDGILPGYRGHVDAVEPVLSGWVSEIAHPAAPVAFTVSIDRRHRIPVTGDRPRADVAAARLVGYGRLDRGRDDAVRLGVVALTVLEAYRRKGLGEALMRALLRGAAVGGLSEVWLSVRPDNTPAVRLYEKLGFVRDASRP